MQKYHKNIGFKEDHDILTEKLIKSLENRKFTFSRHSIDELRLESEALHIVEAIKGYSLAFCDVFEIVIDNDIIMKLGFRIPLNSQDDIIFIINSAKNIVTLWTNSKEDRHVSLNPNNYSIV
jgi:hypothetical protein